MQKSYDEAYIGATGKEKAGKRIYNPKFMTSMGISIVDVIRRCNWKSRLNSQRLYLLEGPRMGIPQLPH